MSRNWSSAMRAGIAILILLPIMLGTSPRPLPYHEYVIHGSLARASEGSKQNFVVSLVRRMRNFDPDSLVELVPGWALYTSPALKAITDTNGAFMLDVQATSIADSIGIKVSAADKPVYVSGLIAVPSTRTEITEQSPSTSHGCHGCESTTGPDTYVVGYRYQFPDLSLAIPY